MRELMIATRKYREMMLNDPYRPTYHFAIPDDNGAPGDPNGAFYADGIYHLMYLYKNSNTNAYHWGHISSVDLLHWRHHPDALTNYNFDEGCYSGGAFVDDDGTAYLSFWKLPDPWPNNHVVGIALACAVPPYDHWERMEPIAICGTQWGVKDVEINGQIIHLGCSDPSNIWKMNGNYYMQLGALDVLNKYGRKEDSPEIYQGDWTELYRSRDLKNWEFVHRFYTNPHLGDDWPDRTEDDMCPCFYPLYDAKSNGNPTGKWLQLFISHNKGCQYYVGTLNPEEESFHPEVHGRMSWKDNTFFAPEALIDDKNRIILWTWLVDNPKLDYHTYHWSGVYSFPRCVWWENEELHMAPAEELTKLQYNHQTFTKWEDRKVPVKNGESFRIQGTWNFENADHAGLRIKESSDHQEYTEIYVDKAAGKLVMDTTHSGIFGRMIKEEAPFVLKEGETLHLDIFVDKSVIEVYANERQGICRRVYVSNPSDAVYVYLPTETSLPEVLEAWEMAPSNPY